ncbi:MAG: hypothetical protein WA981_08475 [Glaciecola sp.]
MANKANVFSVYEKKFEQLAPREQKLLFYGIPITILILGILLFIEPTFIAAQKVDRKMASVQTQLQSANAVINELNAQAELDPNLQVKQKINTFDKRVQTLQKRVDGELNQLVGPQLMPYLLEQLFAEAKGLQLTSMRTSEPTNVFANQKDVSPIYKHKIDIEFEGGFFATRDFLATAENMDYKLYWDEIQYEVSEYPNATTKLSIFTLSTSEVFISVQ